MRLTWPDTVKGMAILWIVFFHGFKEFSPYPWPLYPNYWNSMCGATNGAVAVAGCAVRATVVAVASVGFHCVAVFLLLSGFALGFTTARRGPAVSWKAWYKSRLARLFPLYWTAHLLYLVSPSVFHLEAIDYRFLLSFLGDRIFPLEIFLYANAAWWYFGLLVQLYFVFPALWWLLERLGSARFLILAGLTTAMTRYLLLFPFASEYSEALLLGAMFPSRLFEFSVGIVWARAFALDPAACDRYLFHPLTGLLGLGLYTAGVYSYGNPIAYLATDALVGCGLTILLAHLAKALETLPLLQARLGWVGRYSYGLYLFHQPYMIWLGRSLVGSSLPLFFALGGVATLVLGAASIVIEKGVNRLSERWLARTA